MFLKQFAHDKQEVLMRKLPARNVHSDGGRRQAIRQPYPYLPARFAQYPGAEFHNKPGFFRQRNKFRGAYKAALGMLPAHQGLGACQHSCFGIYFRLIKKPELAAQGRIVQFAAETQYLQRAVVQVGRIEAVGISALLLGEFQRHGSTLHQRIPIHAVIRKYRDANAAGHEHLMAADMKRRSHHFQKPAGNRHDTFRLIDLNQQHRKLIATQARQARHGSVSFHTRDGVAAANPLFQPLGYCL